MVYKPNNTGFQISTYWGRLNSKKPNTSIRTYFKTPDDKAGKYYWASIQKKLGKGYIEITDFSRLRMNLLPETINFLESGIIETLEKLDSCNVLIRSKRKIIV